FLSPAQVDLVAQATDVDGTVVSVDFFADTNRIGTLTSEPFALTWSNVPPGVYALTARATDNESASAVSEPLRITVTNAPVFFLSQSQYESSESDAVATVTVRRNTGGAATVAFATLNATARAVVDGSIGNYYAASGLLTFGSGELSRQIQIQLVDDL